MAPYITYNQINDRYKEELSKGNRYTIANIRKILEDESSTKTPYQPASNMVSAQGEVDQEQRQKTIEDYNRAHTLGVKTGDDAMWDFVGNTLWSFGNIALLGTPDILLDKAAPELREAQLADWNDTKAGRVGGMIGNAVGFLNVMKGVKSAVTNVGARTFSKGTRSLQKKAGQKLAESINKETVKNLNKTNIKL